MRKIFTIVLLTMLVSLQSLQAKIVWDFAGKGFSAATIANLTADNSRWNLSSATRFANSATMSGELTANGQVIVETAGIKFGSMGSGKVNIDHGYLPPRLMLNGTNLTFTLPGLIAGQKITIVTMTANTSSARGISCSSNNATRISGDATSLVENTNVFEVNATVTDPIDVTFTTGSTGGIHLRYISMEGNEIIDPDAPINIAYLFDSSYPGNSIVGTDDDMILQSGLMQKNVYPIDIKYYTNDTAAVFKDSLAALERYDVVVISEAIAETQPFGLKLQKLVNRVPMLNLKASFYNSDSWNWGTCQNPTDVSTQEGIPAFSVRSEFTTHPIFAELDILDGFTVYDGTDLTKNLVQGYTLNEGSIYENDSLLANVISGTDTIKAIHKHGTNNAYMLIPLCSDAASTLNENAILVVYNAAIHLAATKTEVVAAIKPTISQEYMDGYTLVSLSTGTPASEIHYTLDGTEPTLASPIYTTKMQLTDSLTVKAITTKQGFDDSQITTAKVIIKTKVAAPTISVVPSESGKIVTLSGLEGSIYYTLSGATPTATTAILYTVPFQINRPCTVNAVSIMDNHLNSDMVSEKVSFDGYVERNKTLIWANFYDQPASWRWANTDTTTLVSGDVISKYAYTAPTQADTTLTPLRKTMMFENGFLAGSYGQRINLQTTGVATSGNYSPETDGDAGATSYAISFLTTNASTDPTNAHIVTPEKQTGPFDITVWFTGAKGSVTYVEKLEVAVSETNDSNATWTVLDTLITYGDKLIRKRIAYYDATTPVYVKLTSATNLGTNSNMMIFDLRLMGEGEEPVVSLNRPIQTEKTIVSSKIYTITGIEVKKPVVGLNLIRTIYSDGSVRVQKIMNRYN